MCLRDNTVISSNDEPGDTCTHQQKFYVWDEIKCNYLKNVKLDFKWRLRSVRDNDDLSKFGAYRSLWFSMGRGLQLKWNLDSSRTQRLYFKTLRSHEDIPNFSWKCTGRWSLLHICQWSGIAAIQTTYIPSWKLFKETHTTHCFPIDIKKVSYGNLKYCEMFFTCLL